MFGSMLFAFGGYTMPFIFFGSLSVLMTIVVIALVGNQQVSDSSSS
jgi:hypothetical protein